MRVRSLEAQKRIAQTRDKRVQLGDLVQGLHESGETLDEHVDALADRLHRVAIVHRLRRRRVTLRGRDVCLRGVDRRAYCM